MNRRPMDLDDAEAFRALRTALLFRPDRPPSRRITITGPAEAAPVQRVCAGIVRAIAATGARAVLVDCDLRDPHLHEHLGLSRSPGLADSLTNGLSPQVQALDGAAGFVAAGTADAQTRELLTAERFQTVVDLVLEKADHVVLSTEPLRGSADAAVIAARSDAVLLVLHAGHTSREDAGYAVDLLRSLNAPLLGAVLVQ